MAYKAENQVTNSAQTPLHLVKAELFLYTPKETVKTNKSNADPPTANAQNKDKIQSRKKERLRLEPFMIGPCRRGARNLRSNRVMSAVKVWMVVRWWSSIYNRRCRNIFPVANVEFVCGGEDGGGA
jgi:hypothetical protein